MITKIDRNKILVEKYGLDPGVHFVNRLTTEELVTERNKLQGYLLYAYKIKPTVKEMLEIKRLEKLINKLSQSITNKCDESEQKAKKYLGYSDEMRPSKRETTFENAKENDRVYSPLFRSVNPGDKTNATIMSTTALNTYDIAVKPDIEIKQVSAPTFTIKGEYFSGSGQCLFWENPINEIPVRPKRKVIKKGYVGVCPHESVGRGRLALTSNVYDSKDTGMIPAGYQVVPIEFTVEE